MTTTPTPAPDAAEIEALIARIENDGPFFDCIGEPIAELEIDIIAALRSLSRPVEVTDAVRLRTALQQIARLGLGPDHGSAQWQVDTAREIARAALGGRDNG